MQGFPKDRKMRGNPGAWQKEVSAQHRLRVPTLLKGNTFFPEKTPFRGGKGPGLREKNLSLPG